jgi:putative membrane protein
MILTRTIKILMAVLIIMLPVGLFLMLSGEVWKHCLWTTNIFLGLQAVITFIFLLNSAEKKSVTAAAVLIPLIAFTMEFIGVKTGFPFGKYSYTKTLEPGILGVPVAISLSWFSVAVNSYLVSRFFLIESKVQYILLASGFIILGIDILLEPFATDVNGYWAWAGGSVPLQNYLSWFMLGILFSALLEQFAIWNRNIFLNINFISIPAAILAINILQFTVVDLFYGYYSVTLTGLIIIAACVFVSLRTRKNES